VKWELDLVGGQDQGMTEILRSQWNEANDQFISRARNSSVVYHVTGREVLLGARYKF
jgi:hypothetical protein